MKSILLTLWLCLFSSAVIAAESLPVFVSIAPQKFFVQQIGKDRVNVQVMVPPGASPHTYEPKPRQMAALARSELYFAIGVAFEKTWLKKLGAASPRMKVIHTDHGIEKIPMARHDHHTATDAHEEPHHDHHTAPNTHDDPHRGQEGRDPHIWLSPPLVKIQAQTILSALQDSDPANRDFYAANYRQFISAIEGLHRELTATFAGHAGLQFMVFHPSWGYFAQAYGLQQVPVEIEGKAPKPAQLQELIEHARSRDIRVLFVQPQFATKSARLVAREIGGQVVLADPLAENWFGNIRTIAAKFKLALR